ncbi:tyrosine-type recombinase/integrase [Devosia submarina]|uniref:tyrosine-type recombinase/integrase n=1 Tax=Devosia submarina TaxID=1173082 RepID=UPI001FE6D55A|nr:site-specific integrase [Devosia submarina]
MLTPKGRETMQTRGGKGSAAEVRKWTRAMFQFGVEVDLLPSNPLADVRNRDRQTPRDRVLQMEELRQIWSAATALAHPWGHLFKLLMLTGSRRSEWANARVDWLKAESTILEVPAEQYKTRKPQVVPLSTQAQAIVRSLPQGNNGPFLFSTTGGLVPVSGFSKAKTQLDQQITMQKQSLAISWVTHDLRRSMATHMERLGIEPHVIELCLGHKLTGIAATYRHYGYLPEKQVALQRWADELLA